LEYVRVLCQYRFNFSKFDAEAANLYLIVNATEELDVAVWSIAG
jgi:hypothetical protein